MSPESPADTSPVAQAPSILGHLLQAGARPERQFREALFLTFNIDVGFFETRLLGACRAAGAAVTVVADAYVYALDPRSARAAGQTYALGLAAAPGAFHPKLSVLAGPEQALIGIGSGNITVNGWHRSDEISLVVDADTTSCPRIVADLADWLDELPAAVTIGSIAADGIRRTADQLRHLATRSTLADSGHRLVSSTRGPILEQLPPQRVRTLRLYAPFHDPGGGALRAMCRRWEPELVRVAVQPGVTVIAPDVLGDVAADAGARVTFHACEVAPYRHGKLVEADCENGSSWSLTGSPNLTTAGLLGHLPRSGNCELGVVTANTPPLFPGTDGNEVAAQSIPVVLRISPDDPARTAMSRSGPVLISATLLQGALLRVEFARVLPHDVTVQISDYRSLPEEYRTLGTVPAGSSNYELPVADAQAGARIRLRWTTDDGPMWGPDMPLVDPDKASQRVRPSHGTRANTDADPLDLFQDPQLANAWTAKMNELVTSAPKMPAAPLSPRNARPVDGQTQPSGHRTLDDADTWLRYTDDARARLGSMMVDFALGGLPRIANAGSAGPATPIWVDRLGGDDDQYDDEHTAEEQDADAALDGRANRTRTLQAYERARYRRWLRDLTDTAPHVEAIDRLARGGLVLLGTRMQIWDGPLGPHGWFHLLVSAVRALPDEIPTSLKQQAAAFTAVAIYRLDHALPLDRRSPESKLLRTLVEERLDLLHSAEREGVDANTQSLRVGLEPPTDAAAVWDHLAAVLGENHADAVLRDLERAFPDFEITHVHGDVFRVDGVFPNPVKAGADILDQLDGPTVAAVVATNGSVTATLIRNADRLTIVRAGPGPRTYTSFRLGPLTSITGLASGGETAQRHRLNRGPLQRLSDEAAEDLRAAGLD